MTQHTIRRRCVAFLAIGAMAALAMPSTAQAAPQLADLGVKQSMSVKASNGESLEGKDLRAIQLATYTAASVDGNTIVGYDLTTNTALAPDITAAAKTAGATDANLTVNGKNDPMAWVVKNLTDSRSDLWSGKLRNFCNSLAKQTNFAKQEGTAVAQNHHVDRQRTCAGNLRHRGPYPGNNHAKQRNRRQNDRVHHDDERHRGQRHQPTAHGQWHDLDARTGDLQGIQRGSTR